MKIIGILLLSILGLFLLLVTVTLLVPVRYRAEVRHGEGLFFLKGRVNWLFHILHVNISHIEGVWHIRARIFGYVLFDNLRPRKPGRPEGKDKSGKAKRRKREAAGKRAAEQKEAARDTDTLQDVGEEISESRTEPMISEQKIRDQKTEGIGRPEETGTVQPMKRAEETGKAKYSEEAEAADKTEPMDNEEPIGKEDPMGEAGDDEASEAEENPEYGGKAKKQPLFRRIADKLRGIYRKIAAMLRQWKEKILGLFATISSARDKGRLIMDFIRNERNREGFQVTWGSLKKALKHIMPRKLRSKLVFGTGDPCSTGQALGAMSILYSFYGDRIQITPDFENSRLEGEHFASGRIRLVTILIILIRLLFNKGFKKLKGNFNILKEAL
ncbi:hypothetical protein HNQ56_004199 [Anaerotaenia torta]|uniref:DUF2953 domain-containing protein n=1 Tax=Anaerotaenia torta TaxID=433293 RepID=UPI003D234C29